MDDELLGRQSAFNEAALCRMVGDENTIEELRELIAVPPKIDSNATRLRPGRPGRTPTHNTLRGDRHPW